jgi:hypothetical protein
MWYLWLFHMITLWFLHRPNLINCSHHHVLLRITGWNPNTFMVWDYNPLIWDTPQLGDLLTSVINHEVGGSSRWDPFWSPQLTLVHGSKHSGQRRKTSAAASSNSVAKMIDRSSGHCQFGKRPHPIDFARNRVFGLVKCYEMLTPYSWLLPKVRLLTSTSR